MTRPLPPRIRAIVDRTPRLLRQFRTVIALKYSKHDQFGAYERLLQLATDRYWHDVNAALAELVARDLEATT